ncbi:hypothetical protein ACH5AL_15285 [Actinacidiphila glaucinigra]|uniref:hypothetical protein n=1 Tax=Actinacidiphila glaucinigra TaxID=235986 RepID=UPI0037BB55DE
MAMRGTPARRAAVVGGPLVGVLREVDRRSRSTTRVRGTVVPPVEGREGPPGPPGPAGSPAARTAAAVVETGADGSVRWDFAEAFDAPPVVGALLVMPGGGQLLTATLEEVTAAYAVVRVWRHKGGRSHAADPGQAVHLTATAAT